MSKPLCFKSSSRASDCPVALTGKSAMVHFQVVVIVPRLTGPRCQTCTKPHAAFYEPPGDEDLLALACPGP